MFRIHILFKLIWNVLQDRSQTRPQNTSQNIQATENEKATPSSTLAWKIPWTEEPGRL